MTDTLTATEAPTEYELALDVAADALGERFIRCQIVSKFMATLEINAQLADLRTHYPRSRHKSLEQTRRTIKRLLECRYNQYELARCDTEAMDWVLST